MPNVSIAQRINPGDPEADNLLHCFVTQPGGMMDLMNGTIGTRLGTADPTRSNEQGTLDAYFDGTGDGYTFGTGAIGFTTSTPFTIAWEMKSDVNPSGFPVPWIFATGSESYECYYVNGDGVYGDLTFGSDAIAWGRFRASTSGAVDLNGERHWACLTYNGGGATTIGNFACYMNGKSLTLSTSGAFGALLDGNAIGNDYGGFLGITGVVRQVRIYDREWSLADHHRFWHPSTRDSLFAPPRRRIYFGVSAAAPSIVGPLIGGSHLLTNGPLINGRLAA